MRTTDAPRRSAIAVAAVALVAMLLAACQPESETNNVAAINQLRASVAVPALNRMGELDAKARAQADRMARRGKIFHSSSLAAGVSPGWGAIGENVASAGSIEAAEAALEASPQHYQNLTHPGFTEVGVGVTVKNGVYYVVQIFVAR